MTEQEKFFKAIKGKGFTVNKNFFAQTAIIPHHRRTPDGHHNIVSNINVVNFMGSDSKEGDLGCVTFSCTGVQRQKFHEISQNPATVEIIKHTFCPVSAKVAIETYTEWLEETKETLDSWELVL